MDRNEDNSNRVQLQRAERTQPVEVTAEITLPDYRSEISRLLWVRPTVLPPTRFMGGGKAELSGPIRYDILYVGSDGGLYDAAIEEGYAFSVPTDTSAGGVQELFVEVVPEAVISRVTGPRKLSVRCRMRAAIRGFAEKELAPVVRGGASAPERLCEAVNCLRHFAAMPAHCEVGDAIELDPSVGEIRVLAPRGELFLQEVSATDTGILCRGEVLCTVLICKEEGDGASEAILRRIPFEREVPVEGITPDCCTAAMGKVGETRATVEQGKITVEMDVVLWGEAQAEECTILCRDMHLPGCVADRRFAEEQLQTAGFCGNRNFSVSGERSLGDLGLSQDVHPIYTTADAELVERRVEGNKTWISGELHCHTLYRTDAEYGVADFSVPFRTAVEGAFDTIAVGANAPSCHVSVVRDTLRADGEIVLALRATTSGTERVLAEVGFSADSPAPRADMELCYPASDDTLWDVACRYGVSTDALAGANGLSADVPGAADSLAGVKYLLIP